FKPRLEARRNGIRPNHLQATRKQKPGQDAGTINEAPASMHGTPLCRGSVNFWSRFRLRYWRSPPRVDCVRQKKAPTGRTSRGGQLRKSDHKASGISSQFHRILRTTARLDIVSLPKPRWMSRAATEMVESAIISRG